MTCNQQLRCFRYFCKFFLSFEQECVSKWGEETKDCGVRRKTKIKIRRSQNEFEEERNITLQRQYHHKVRRQ